MKARRTLAILVCALCALPCGAQAAPGPTAPAPTAPGPTASGPTAGPPSAGSTVPQVNPAAGPGEPDLILPQMVLRVEDLSVENVEAQLPPEEEMLAPVRTIPLLSEGELAVGEPSLGAAAVESEGAGGGQNPRPLSADVQIGTGSTNMILGSVDLATLGADPRLSVQFHHESLDGFDGHSPGSGFNTRDDNLDGGLRFRLGGADAALAGGFKEDETGLQGQSLSGYSSALSRAFSGSASLSGRAADWLTLNAGAEGGLDSLTLQGASPLLSNGIRLTPSASAAAQFGGLKIGVQGQYWYRDDFYLSGGQDGLHRVKVGPFLSYELPAAFLAQASGGWFWNSAGLSRFPFSVSLTGTPLAFLTLSVEGGYTVVPYDMHDILSASALALPTMLADDRGWYGAAGAQLSLTRDVALTFKGQYMSHEAMPSGATVLDPGTGLFPVTQGNATQLWSDVGLRWSLTQAFSLTVGWDHQFMDRPFFTPIDALSAGLVGADPGGRFGGSLTVAAGPIYDGSYQQPLVHLSGFWKIIDAVKLQLDGDDLLGPLLNGPRWSIAQNTYITPGFRIYGTLSVSL